MTATLSEFDRMVSALRAQGIPREKAERAARVQLQLPDPATEITEDSIEDEHVKAGDDLCCALGGVIVKLSQKRRSKVTEGIPDRRYYFPRRKLVFWWEAKASWGRQTLPQRNFQELCAAVGDAYVLGGIEQLRKYLTTIGIATFDERGLPQPIAEEQT